jgi:DNA repair exonuclease SbcCD ATPase subunit
MDYTRRQQLTRQRAVAKASLTRMQTFIETGDRKPNDMQVRSEELSNVYNKFETAQTELELFDDVDHSADRQKFEDQYFAVTAKFNELLHSCRPTIVKAQFLTQ